MENEKILTVIIATTAEHSRSKSLLRAIQSIRDQDSVPTEILIVINGENYDKKLFSSLSKDTELTIRYLAIGNLPKAIEYSVTQVKTPFFSFLDDDDCYLKNTLFKRIEPMKNDSSIDYVIHNGYNYTDGVDKIRVDNFPSKYDENSASLILEENWLASSGGTFRRSATSDIFKNIPKYLEWTYIGFKLSIAKKGMFINTPVYRIWESEISLSKSEQYIQGTLYGLKEIINIAPKNLKNKAIIKYGKMLHDLSSRYLKEGKFAIALKYHLLSLKNPKGVSYILFTRYFVYDFVKSFFSQKEHNI